MSESSVFQDKIWATHILLMCTKAPVEKFSRHLKMTKLLFGIDSKGHLKKTPTALDGIVNINFRNT